MANALGDLLQGQLSEMLVDQLSAQIGGANREQVATASSGILATLTAALARNAKKPAKARKLNEALERDHDGSILDNLGAILGGNSMAAPANVNPKALDGAGILGHILGKRQNGASDMISKISGMNSSQVKNLMTILAPILMGAVGKTKRQENVGASGLGSLLTGALKNTRKQQGASSKMGILGRFLDQDGDGQVIDDIMGMVGKGLFKNLFGRR